MVAGSRIVDVATVRLWGHDIGAVYWDDASNVGAFEYTAEFQRSGVELAPLMMPLGPRIHRFPELARSSFRGLPGLLADSLPDDFGNALIRQWLIREGRDEENFSPVEQLCYIGQRGTGALEFRPARRQVSGGSVPLHLGSLVDLAGDVLAQRDALSYSLGVDDAQALEDILRVGPSAGGARAKAVVAWNPKSGELRSGQVNAPTGFE
jgi:serine/threonine-protein kinase HipA